jgi:hypothetical protein
VQVDIFVLFVGNQQKDDASSASEYITGMHFLSHFVDAGRGSLECSHVGWHVVTLY